jgi:FAD synthetase
MSRDQNHKRTSRAKRVTVLATGAFDILHSGHIRFLEESRTRGGPKARLVVVVARDKTVRQRKGRNPILPEEERLKIVSSLRMVDRAILGHERLDLLGILEEENPDLVAIGHDQNQIGAAVMKVILKAKLPIRVIRIPEFGPARLNSSTKVKSRIFRQYQSLSR